MKPSLIEALRLVIINYVVNSLTKKQVQEILNLHKLSFDVSTLLKEYNITKDSSRFLSSYVDPIDLETYYESKLELLTKDVKTKDKNNVKLKVLDNRITVKSDNEKDLIFIFSDWHVGKIINMEYNKFDTETLYSRLYKVWQDILTIDTDNIRSIRLLFLGDLMESPNRQSRKSSIVDPDIDQVNVSATLVFNTIKLVHDRFKITPKCMFMSGNHDRGTNDPFEDYNRFPYEDMISLVTANLQSNAIPAEIVTNKRRTGYDDVNDEIRLIYFHGDACSKIDHLTMADRSSKHKLLVQGHLHYKSFVDKGLSYTHIINPSLCGVSEYEFDDLGYIGDPGQAVVECVGRNINVRWLNV